MSFLKHVLVVSLLSFASLNPSLAQTLTAQGATACQAQRPDFCLQIYSPVCAYVPKQCFVAPCPQYEQYSNGCEACRDPLVQSYLPRPCTEAEVKGYDTADPIAQEVELGELGYSETTEEWTFQSEEEHLDSQEADFSRAEEEILSADDISQLSDPTRHTCRPGAQLRCSFESIPVCTTPRGCNDESCRKTSTNGCLACSIDDAEYYMDGACPGDNNA